MQGSSLIKKIDLLNHIQHGILVVDIEGTILYCNLASEEIFGYSSEELIGKSIKLLHEKDDFSTLEQLLGTCRKEEKFKGRWRAKCKHGTRLWLDVQSSTFLDKANCKKYCVITINNIDPLETAKKDLEKVAALEKTILETSADAIITADGEGKILSFNRAAVQMFGYQKDEIIGKDVDVLVPILHIKSKELFLSPNYTKLKKLSNNREIDIQANRKNGSVFFINMSVSSVPWNGEKMFVCIARDLTQKRDLEKRMIDIANEERERIGRELHDGLGQMLTGIRMVAENLARKLKANEIPGADEVREIAEMVQEADEQARALSRGLVDVNLIEKGLSNALENLVERVNKTFSIESKYTEIGRVSFDNHTTALHIYRIVQEAVTNAIRHADAENIQIRLSKNDLHTAIIIENDGPEFDPRDLKNHGSGIQIMKYRADIMGGILDIRRTEDDKTQVRCIIPNNLEYFNNTSESKS